MFDFLTLDFALGLMGACGVWMLGTYVYNATKTGQTVPQAVAGVPADVEGKLKALASGMGNALHTVRQEASVKLSGVESALHDRITALETTVFGPGYSAATQAASASNAPAVSTANPVAAAPNPPAVTLPAPVNPAPADTAALPQAKKVPASQVVAHAAAKHVAASAQAGTAIAGVQAQSGSLK